MAPLVCTLALSTEPPLTSVELRAEQVRQTVLDILSYTRWPTEPSELRLCVAAPTEYATALFSIKQQANGTYRSASIATTSMTRRSAPV